MLRLNFASRGFYFCKHYAAFARAVIYQPAAQRDFGEPKFYELARRRGLLRFTEYDFTDWQHGAVFAGRDFELALRRGFQTAIL